MIADLEDKMAPSQGRGNQPPDASPDFGSIELESGGDPLALDLDTSEEPTEPKPDTPPQAAPPPTPAPTPQLDADQTEPLESESRSRGHNPRYAPVEAPRRSYKKEITIAAIVLVVAGVIAGGVYGFMRWRESSQSEHKAKMQALDKSSLDSLKSQAMKQNLGT
jgi:hypothetical protein